MKTTIDLPDELMRRVKLWAVHRDQKLKDTIAQLLERGMAASQEAAKPRPPRPVRLKHRRPLHIEDIESAINAGRE